MKLRSGILMIWFIGVAFGTYFFTQCITQVGETRTQNTKSVLIVYHGGEPPWHSSPPLDVTDVDELTQATPEKVNVKIVVTLIQNQLTAKGFRVDLIKATDVHGPHEFLEYDGIIFGTPTWFSNVAYPIKKLFDEYLIRIYSHRSGRFNDKVLAGFTTVMDRKSGPQCLQSLTWGLDHLSKRVVKGAVINTNDDDKTVNAEIQQFCKRFSQVLKE